MIRGTFRGMLVRSLVILISLSFVLGIDDAISQKSEAKFSTYQNPSLNMKILYPSSWTQIIYPPFTYENPTPFFIVYFTPFSTNGESLPVFTIKVQNLSSDERSNFNYEEIRRLEETYSDFKMIRSGTGPPLANISSYSVEYTHKEIEGLVKSVETWITKDGKVYTITYSAKDSAYEEYLPIIRSMISSLSGSFLKLWHKQYL